MKNSQYVITARNRENSKFHIIEKKWFRSFVCRLAIIKLICYKIMKDVKDEEVIIEMMKNGDEFHTYNKLDKSFTDVVVVNDHIKTSNNNNVEDNISYLPILIK